MQLYGLQYIGLGRGNESGSAHRGGDTTSSTDTATTTTTPTADHVGGSYSSDGTVEKWYFDEESGRKIYTEGARAGTYEQIADPKPRQTAATSPTSATAQPTAEDNNDIWLLLPVAAVLLLFWQRNKGTNNKRKSKR